MEWFAQRQRRDARVRRRKDDVELARMRLAADATCAGFAAAVPLIAPGISERALQIEIEGNSFVTAQTLSRTTRSSSFPHGIGHMVIPKE